VFALPALAVLMLALLPGAAGPLGLRTQGTLRELFLDVTAADARPLERPELDLRWSFANDWNEPMQLTRHDDTAYQFLDEQADSLTASYKAPWPRLPFVWSALEGRLTEHWGGWSDRPIEAWHRLTGAFNYQRAEFPRDQVRLLYADSGGTAFDVRSARLAVGDLVARTQASVLQGARGAVALRFDLKAPTGMLSRLGGSGGVDFGGGALGTLALTPWFTLHGLVALSHFANLSAPTALQPKPWHWSFELSLAFALGDTQLLLEDRCLSPLLPPGWSRTPGGGDDALLSSGLYAGFRVHNQVSAGVRRGRFSVWASEDFTPGPNPHSTIHWIWVSNAPDFVLGLAFSQPL
jgi:hypothetical protein